jgi:hypothetical protein
LQPCWLLYLRQTAVLRQLAAQMHASKATASRMMQCGDAHQICLQRAQWPSWLLYSQQTNVLRQLGAQMHARKATAS